MRVAVACVVALAVCAASVTSCFVSRLSDGFTCSGNGDCHDGRVCDQGYCVETMCPSPCTSCDTVDRTCRIDCNGSKPCGAVQCPAGYDCTIRCNAGACGDIDCAQGTGCRIDCGGSQACGAINCGKAACQVDCSGPQSCPSIDCRDSCRCDVSCSNLQVACPSMACPDRFGTLCTRNGTVGERCNSSEDIVCDICFNLR